MRAAAACTHTPTPPPPPGQPRPSLAAAAPAPAAPHRHPAIDRTLVAVVGFEAVVGRHVEVVGLQVEACTTQNQRRTAVRQTALFPVHRQAPGRGDPWIGAGHSCSGGAGSAQRPGGTAHSMHAARRQPAAQHAQPGRSAHRGRACRARAAACRARSTPPRRPPQSRAGRCGWGGSKPAKRGAAPGVGRRQDGRQDGRRKGELCEAAARCAGWWGASPAPASARHSCAGIRRPSNALPCSLCPNRPALLPLLSVPQRTLNATSLVSQPLYSLLATLQASGNCWNRVGTCAAAAEGVGLW